MVQQSSGLEERPKRQRRFPMKTQDMIDSLLKLGIQRGVITCQELSDAFPAEFFPLEELERFLRLLEELGVKVVESEKKLRRKTRLSTA